MIYDPLASMMQRRDDNKQSNLIRNKLQVHARNLCSKAYALSKRDDAKDGDLHEMIGELQGYIATRKFIAPLVAQDGYSNELLRAINTLKDRLKKSNC